MIVLYLWCVVSGGALWLPFLLYTKAALLQAAKVYNETLKKLWSVAATTPSSYQRNTPRYVGGVWIGCGRGLAPLFDMEHLPFSKEFEDKHDGRNDQHA